MRRNSWNVLTIISAVVIVVLWAQDFRTKSLIDDQNEMVREEIDRQFRVHSAKQGAWATDRQIICDHIGIDCSLLPSTQPEYLK